jgi:hypothetical protein
VVSGLNLRKGRAIDDDNVRCIILIIVLIFYLFFLVSILLLLAPFAPFPHLFAWRLAVGAVRGGGVVGAERLRHAVGEAAARPTQLPVQLPARLSSGANPNTRTTAHASPHTHTNESSTFFSFSRLNAAT